MMKLRIHRQQDTENTKPNMDETVDRPHFPWSLMGEILWYFWGSWRGQWQLFLDFKNRLQNENILKDTSKTKDTALFCSKSFNVIVRNVASATKLESNVANIKCYNLMWLPNLKNNIEEIHIILRNHRTQFLQHQRHVLQYSLSE